MVAPVAAVAGAGRFAGLSPAVERPYARYRNLGGVPVLIAGGQRGHNEGTEQEKGKNERQNSALFLHRKTLLFKIGHKKRASDFSDAPAGYGGIRFPIAYGIPAFFSKYLFEPRRGVLGTGKSAKTKKAGIPA